jgi:hypothetical protein
VNTPWAICVARADESSLTVLRLCEGIEVGEADRVLWLRGQRCDEVLGRRLALLPALGRYDWLLPAQIRLRGRRIPAGDMPRIAWQPLGDWLQIAIPTPAMPASPPEPVALTLIRSTDERDPGLLLTLLDELIRFSATAAAMRLAPLQFAVNEAGLAYVLGQPLPPVPGCRFVLHGRVAVPAGCGWAPAVADDVLARCLGATGGALVAWNEDGTITRLLDEQFVPMSRSALRATLRATQSDLDLGQAP